MKSLSSQAVRFDLLGAPSGLAPSPSPVTRFNKDGAQKCPRQCVDAKINMKQWLCPYLNAPYTVAVNKVSEKRFLPPSIPSKWRGLRGLVLRACVVHERHLVRGEDEALARERSQRAGDACFAVHVLACVRPTHLETPCDVRVLHVVVALRPAAVASLVVGRAVADGEDAFQGREAEDEVVRGVAR